MGPEIIATCSVAVRELVSRLQALDYPVDPMLVACVDVDNAIAALEESGTGVPPALAEVWRQIGGISLVDLDHYRHMAFWEERLGGDGGVFACDGVVVEAPNDEAWIGYVLDLFDEQADIGQTPGFPISPDALHKDNTSGGGPYEIVPDGGDPWMASLREFSWNAPVRPTSAPPGSAPDLVSYLRTAILECAGFPGLLGTAGFEPLRRELTQGLPVF
ncbi:MAG: hypothetical protein OES24_08970 [Acidimicrobiia bacterium]|nr:hypothetical protein [Acidimicrobiia bacterium]